MTRHWLATGSRDVQLTTRSCQTLAPVASWRRLDAPIAALDRRHGCTAAWSVRASMLKPPGSPTTDLVLLEIDHAMPAAQAPPAEASRVHQRRMVW